MIPPNLVNFLAAGSQAPLIGCGNLVVAYVILPSEVEHGRVMDCVVEQAKIHGGKNTDAQLARDIWTCSGSVYLAPSDIKVTKSSSRIVVALEYDRPITLFGVTVFVRHFSVDESRPIY